MIGLLLACAVCMLGHAQSVGVFGTAVATKAGGQIALTVPVQYQTYQRSGTTGTIGPISGTYAGGTPTTIEASFNGGAFANTNCASISGGVFSGCNLTSQAQGQGTLTLRWSNDHSVTTSVTLVGIGDVFAIIGDSIAAGRAQSGVTSASSGLCVKFEGGPWPPANDDASGTWQAFTADPLSVDADVDSHWPLLCQLLAVDQNVPIAMISQAVGGSDCWRGGNSGWSSTGPGSLFSGIETKVTTSGVNGVRAILAILGSNAMASAGQPTSSQYATCIENMANGWNAAIAGSPVTILGQNHHDATGSGTRTTTDQVTGGLIAAVTNGAIKMGPVTLDNDWSGGLHPIALSELQQLADRFWVAISNALYSGNHGRGPRVTTASIDGPRQNITLTYDQTLGQTNGTALTAGVYRVFLGGVLQTTSTATVQNGNQVLVSLSAGMGAGTVTMDFASEDDMANILGGTPTVDAMSQAITLPDSRTVKLPPEPFFGQTIPF